ncbi:MAG TPA: hypothetical protein VLT86_19600, partial [Vicinamibacterales bacterium]|nr:hypothetical protein [Vicinamibacterales bacterium]
TLIYLALQIRHNSEVLEAQIEDAIATGFMSLNATVASNPQLGRIFVQGCEDHDALNAEERIQFNFILRAYGSHYLRMFQLYRQGVLPRDRWEFYGREAAQHFATAGGRAWRSNETNPSFRDFWDEIDRFEIGRVFSLR